MNMRLYKAMGVGFALVLMSSLEMSAFSESQKAIKMTQKGITLQRWLLCHVNCIDWFVTKGA